MFREAASQYDKLARPLDRDRCQAESAGAPDGSFDFDNQRSNPWTNRQLLFHMLFATDRARLDAAGPRLR
jgi:hypothetical protein